VGAERGERAATTSAGRRTRRAGSASWGGPRRPRGRRR
jgi:hypothetical protein